jgi:hypothetical protein
MDDLPKSSKRPSSVGSWPFTRQSPTRSGLQARRMTHGSAVARPGTDHSEPARNFPLSSNDLWPAGDRALHGELLKLGHPIYRRVKKVGR